MNSPDSVRRSAVSGLAGAGLALTLVLATLGEGGGAVHGLLAWHSCLLLVSIALLLVTRHDPGHLPAAGPVIAIALFALLVCAGALRAPFAYGAWLLVLELGAALGVIAIASTAGSIAGLVWPLRIAGAVHGIVLLVQRFGLDQVRPAASFLNPNHAAAWLVAVLLIGLAGLPAPDRRSRFVAAIVCASFAAGGVLVAGSRGAFLGLAGGGLLLLAVNWHRLHRGFRLGAVAAVLVMGLLVGARQVERLNQPDPFRYQRVSIWRASSALVLAEPFWGSGPGQFAVAAANLRFPDADGPLRFDRRFSVTHSDWLRPFAEVGVPAGLALIAAIGLALVELRRRHRRQGLDAYDRGALAALCGLAVQALFDNPSRWPSVYLLAAALFGFLIRRQPRKVPDRPGLPIRWLLVVLLAAVYAIGDLGPTLAYLETADLPRGRLDLSGRQRLDRALSRNRIHPDLWMRRAEDLAGAGTDWTPAIYSAAREAAETALRLQPVDAGYWRRLARIESMACRTLFGDLASRERAAAAYGQAERLSRFDPMIPTELSAFLIDTGAPAAARRAAERALRLEPDSVTPRLLLAEAMLRSGEREGIGRARTLLAEAHRRYVETQRYHAQDPYTRALLAPDPSQFERLASLFDAAESGFGGSDPAGGQ